MASGRHYLVNIVIILVLWFHFLSFVVIFDVVFVSCLKKILLIYRAIQSYSDLACMDVFTMATASCLREK